MKKAIVIFTLWLFILKESRAQTNTFPASGSVGIGTTTPLTKLHVALDNSAGSTPQLLLTGATNLNQGMAVGFNTTFNLASIQALSNISSQTGSNILLNPLGGNVAVGLNGAQPLSKLDIKGGASIGGYAGSTAAPANGLIVSGSTGIGIAAPSAQLHTSGSVRFQGITNNNTFDRILVSDVNGNLFYRDASTLSGSGWAFGGNTVAVLKTLGTVDNFDLPVITNNTERMRITAAGNVGIGTTDTKGYRLAVNGTAIATKMVVKLYSAWPDYVFHKSYQLQPLHEIEKFILANNRLPGVPSAKEVEKDGLDLGSTQATLLKKIEELTLYLIEQNKKLEDQQGQIDMLRKELKK